MSIEVSPLVEADRDRWAELWLGYLTFYETELPAATYERTWGRLMRGEGVFGLAAREGGVMVGITHYLFHAHCWTDGPACYLQDLFVDPAVRGTGAGRALIEGVAEAARAAGAERLYWTTQEDNAVARGLYDRVARYGGFVKYDYSLLGR